MLYCCGVPSSSNNNNTNLATAVLSSVSSEHSAPEKNTLKCADLQAYMRELQVNRMLQHQREDSKEVEMLHSKNNEDVDV